MIKIKSGVPTQIGKPFWYFHLLFSTFQGNHMGMPQPPSLFTAVPFLVDDKSKYRTSFLKH